MIKNISKEFIATRMEIFMKESGRMAKGMAMEYMSIKMEKNM